MAGSSFFALLDDIATILDDVAVMTKVAAKKTAGVLGDDLALNAQQVTGVKAERELPVVFAVAKGSLKNKAILVPAALAISAVIPWAIKPLLMIGGAYLCFEGFEKLAHKFLHSKEEDDAHHRELVQKLADPTVDLVAVEKEKIKGAVRTDFILSAEIIAITLGTVENAAFGKQVTVLTAVAIIMTVGVYGIVAGIVKMDDAGLHLMQKKGGGGMGRGLGRFLLAAAPYLMKTLSIAGTAAMFMVGGGIVVHGIHALHHAVEGLMKLPADVPGVGGLLSSLLEMTANGLIGVVVGAICLALFLAVKKVLPKKKV